MALKADMKSRRPTWMLEGSITRRWLVSYIWGYWRRRACSDASVHRACRHCHVLSLGTALPLSGCPQGQPT